MYAFHKKKLTDVKVKNRLTNRYEIISFFSNEDVNSNSIASVLSIALGLAYLYHSTSDYHTCDPRTGRSIYLKHNCIILKSSFCKSFNPKQKDFHNVDTVSIACVRISNSTSYFYNTLSVTKSTQSPE